MKKFRSILTAPRTIQEAQRSWSHWLVVALFGLLCSASFLGKSLIILGFLSLSALINGPVLLLWSACYCFFVNLFPPLALVLSFLLLFSECFLLVKNWRFGVVATFFYTYPFGLWLVEKFWPTNSSLLLIGGVAVGIGLFYGLLYWFYRRNSNSHGLLWSLITVPFDGILLLIPKKRRPQNTWKAFRKPPVRFT